MNRSLSSDHIAFGPETPWQSTFGHLPRRVESEPCVPVIENRRPSRSNSGKPPSSTKRSGTQRSGGSGYRETPPSEDSSRTLRAQGFTSAQPSSRPYETAFVASPALPASPSPPPCYNKALPVTPPESLDGKSLTSTDKSLSPYSKQVVNVLPGTMAARTGRSKSSSRQQAPRRKKKPTKVPQWKVVFKQIFTRSPVDETQFEKIEETHWTEG